MGSIAREKYIMQLGYATRYDARDVKKWSGTPYYMAKAFEEHGARVKYLGPLTKTLSLTFKLQQSFKKN